MSGSQQNLIGFKLPLNKFYQTSTGEIISPKRIEIMLKNVFCSPHKLFYNLRGVMLRGVMLRATFNRAAWRIVVFVKLTRM